MSAAEFARINASEWCLARELEQQWRAVIHASETFEEVVRRVSNEGQVIEVHRNTANLNAGYFRAHIKICVTPATCASFHSGRSGYRAQFYRSTANGERANGFAMASITNAIRSQLRDTRLMTRAWIERSLLGIGSKVWIHQGQWLHLKRNSDRLLFVARWRRELCSSDERRRKLAVWGSLVPRDEYRLDLKGALLTLDGEQLGSSPKKGRSDDIHELGFT